MNEDPKPFSPDGQKVVDRARAEAARLNDNFVGTEHMLLGIVLTECRGQAVLTRMGVNLGTIQKDIEHQIGAGPDQPKISPDKIFFTPRVKKCFAFARKDADRWSHPEIESDHILCALLLEGDGVAAQVLMSLEVDLETLRQNVLKLRDPAFSQEPKRSDGDEKTIPSAETLIGAEGLDERVLQQLVGALMVKSIGMGESFVAATHTLRDIALAEIATLDERVRLRPYDKEQLLRALIEVAKEATHMGEIRSCLHALRRVVNKDGNLMEILQAELHRINDASQVKSRIAVPSGVRAIGSLMQLANASVPIAVTMDFISLWEEPSA